MNHQYNKCRKASNCHCHNKCNKCYRESCNCIEYYQSLCTKCGEISALLTKKAMPQMYNKVGDIILYTYTLTNTGSATICYPIEIRDDKLGPQLIKCNYIPPNSSQTFTRIHTITAEDLNTPSITNTATAYIHVKRNKWVYTPLTSSTVTFGSADVSGSIAQQVILEPGIGADVTVTLTNAGNSLTEAQGVSVLLPFPSGVTAGNILLGDGATVGAEGVTISAASIPIGGNFIGGFRYINVQPGYYRWSGDIISKTYDPNPDNNFITNIVSI